MVSGLLTSVSDLTKELDNALSSVGGVSNNLVGRITDTVNEATSEVNDQVDDTLSSLNDVADLSDLTSSLTNTVGDTLDGALEQVNDLLPMVNDLVANLGESTSGLLDTVGGGVNNLLGSVNQLLGGTLDTVGSLLSDTSKSNFKRESQNNSKLPFSSIRLQFDLQPGSSSRDSLLHSGLAGRRHRPTSRHCGQHHQQLESDGGKSAWNSSEHRPKCPILRSRSAELSVRRSTRQPDRVQP